MILNIIGLALIIVSGMAKGIADRILFHYSTIPEKYNMFYWNPIISWQNKFKDGDPLKGQKFIGSTTFLVFLTDGWHLMQFLNNKLLVLGIVLLMLPGFSLVYFFLIFLSYSCIALIE